MASGRAWPGALALAAALGAGPAAAQSAAPDRPQGRFLQAATRIGQPLDYELRYLHDPAEEVVFPDSLAGFAPFEYAGRTYYPTRTRRGRSLDRAVYHLRTFALAPVQTLALPVAVLRGPDTLTVRPAPAAVRVLATAPALKPGAGRPALRAATALAPVPPLFNYPYWLAGTGAALLALAGGAALFRRGLRRRYDAYKRRKNHRYFLAQFARHAERFTLSRAAANVERAVALWKNYLASLENDALNSFTTREIVDYFNHDDDVRRALATTDQVIYGNSLLDDDEAEIEQAFQRLRVFAEHRYAVLARIRAPRPRGGRRARMRTLNGG